MIREPAGMINVCIECIGQSLDFVRLIRTQKCPPETDKIKQQSAPIYTALFVQAPMRPLPLCARP